MGKLKQGFVHIYTGSGKGKTTAAMGLALRATGAGLRVCLVQFLKSGCYSEHKVLAKIPGITLKQCGRKGWVGKKVGELDIQEAKQGLAALLLAVASGTYALVIADEICMALSLGVVSEKDLLEVLEARLPGVELVLTGRGATPALMRRADVVTVMQEKKHYYQQGVKARKGIEF